ncbi:UDP-glucose dehydrogenase family protein [Peptostreptococcus faecalis]|uniref:UDP-glucose dehydrogenase family protein n=1 Tax=Peptostreptococcus faecalis TaxID=2045015 RepID=UPI000C795C36|nr:UDP-glucose/GDP-mannose dehydrogenase family protein [Peptostreptococcus faecalis]
MKIAIAGVGYVGLVTGVCLAEKGHHHIVCVDVDKDKIKMLNDGIPPIYEKDLEKMMKEAKNRGNIEYTTDYAYAYSDADAIFIAVGTPERSDGSANLDYLKKVIKQIAESAQKDILVIVKSTVPIGTNNFVEEYLKKEIKRNIRAEVASNPEFLAQGTAVRDTLEASRIVIGVESEWAEERMLDIYKSFDNPFVITNRNSAEMVKYASNDFLALKISYMNDIANLCEIVGADIEDVALGMSYDDRIGKNFLKPGIGYGGSCFPKDTKALHWLSNTNGYELKTIKAAIEVNELQKMKLVRQASNMIDSFEGLKVAVLGLTYKPGTDDLREAPSIVNIKYLLERGANVHVYDPVGMENAKVIFSDSIIYENNIDLAIADADMCFIMTEWDQIKKYDIKNYEKLMKRALVFDGRNCYDLEEIKETNIEYYSIGRQ